MIPYDLTGLSLGQARKLLNALEASGAVAGQPYRIHILRNATMEPIEPWLRVACHGLDLHCALSLSSYDAAHDPDELAAPPEADLYVVALDLEALAPNFIHDFLSLSVDEADRMQADILRTVLGLEEALRERTSHMILVHNFALPASAGEGILQDQRLSSLPNRIRAINASLVEALSGREASFVLDLDRIQSRIGHEQFADRRHWHLSMTPYAQRAFKELAMEYRKYIAVIMGKSKRFLVLDCDNTLWGGVVGEDGPAGIQVGGSYPGSAYAEFQKAAKELSRRGVVLAICSKNNREDVLEVLRTHPGMVLHEDDFAVMKIDWNDKVSNLRAIAEETGIGLHNLVFMDDSPFEVGLVREQLPMVETIHLQGDPENYARLILDSGLFEALKLSAEDGKRGAMYRAEYLRAQSKREFAPTDMHGYLRSLDMEATIAPLDSFSVPRVAQLTQKTNQFNLTVRRYTEKDVQGFHGSPDGSVLYLHLKDRFGDSGIVGVAILMAQGGECRIDTFLMSCRVLGRKLDQALLWACCKNASDMGCSSLVGEFRPAKKNAQVAKFYVENGFAPIEPQDGVQRFSLALGAHEFALPDWFKTLDVGSLSN